MSAYGTKRTSQPCCVISAFGGKADIPLPPRIRVIGALGCALIPCRDALLFCRHWCAELRAGLAWISDLQETVQIRTPVRTALRIGRAKIMAKPHLALIMSATTSVPR